MQNGIPDRLPGEVPDPGLGTKKFRPGTGGPFPVWRTSPPTNSAPEPWTRTSTPVWTKPWTRRCRQGIRRFTGSLEHARLGRNLGRKLGPKLGPRRFVRFFRP